MLGGDFDRNKNLHRKIFVDRICAIAIRAVVANPKLQIARRREVIRSIIAGAFFLGAICLRAQGTWVGQDIGPVGLPGSIQYDQPSDTYAVSGSGVDISANADSFYFYYVPLNGDCDVQTKVDSMDDTAPAAKAGLMLRESLAVDSRHVTVELTPEEGAYTSYRTDTGGGTVHASGGAASAPCWLRLKRAGTEVITYRSSDGILWTILQDLNIPMNQAAYIGLAVCSKNNSSLCSAQFSSLGLTVNDQEHGLFGFYYNNSDFTSFVTLRLDSTINFNWGGGSPDPLIGADTFSVHWTGTVTPLYSETYTFYTVSDDGVRLWVDNQLLVDHWDDHGPTEDSGSITLQANQPYTLTMDYHETGVDAVSKLLWSSSSQGKEVIPLEALAPVDTDADQMPDEWENMHGLNPNDPADASQDSDGDGMTNLQEYHNGSDPQDYYNGQIPQLTVFSGNDQKGGSQTLFAQPLVVGVSDGGGQPAVNAPVSFSIADGPGTLSNSAGNAVSSPAEVRTDSQGHALLYFKSSAVLGETIISASAKTTTVSFTTWTLAPGDPGVTTAGVLLWLKGNSGTTTDENGQVSAWADQSGLGNNGFQTSTGNQPQLVPNAIGDKPVVHFSGNQWLGLPDFLSGATQGEIFMIVRATEVGYHRMMNFGTSDYGSAYPWIDGNIDEDFGSTVQYGVGNLSQYWGGYHIYNISSKTNEWIARFDGLEMHRELSNTVGFRPDPLIGRARTENFVGDIAEIIIYDHVLSDSDRRGTQTYLGSKYSVVSSPTTPTELTAFALASNQVSVVWNYPTVNDATEFIVERKTGNGAFSEITRVPGRSYIDPNAQSNQQYVYRVKASNFVGVSPPSNEGIAWTHSSGVDMPLTGMRLWLKADCATSTVTDWKDLSGLNNNALQGPGSSSASLVENALNGRPVVHFGGSQWLNLLDIMSGATEGEIFMVLRGTDSYYRRMMNFGTSGYGSAYPWVDGNIYEDFGSTNQYLVGSPALTPTSYQVYDVSSKTSEWVARFNGTEQHRESSNTVAFRSDPQIGRASNNNFVGDIAEIIIYDHVLSSDERNRVATYLGDKYVLAAYDLDPDGDGLTNSQEEAIGTDPYNADTNGDFVPDGVEYYAGLDPLSDDVDGDGLSNATEYSLGTNPFAADSDGDGVPDGQDAYPLDPSRWQAIASDPNDHTPPNITLTEPVGATLLP